MKATLDHIGIAVRDLAEALGFYRDALGLEVEPPEEVTEQHVRAHFIPVGESALELLEPTHADSPIARYLDRREPGLHHIALGVDDLSAALARLKARGIRLIDEVPRRGAGDDLIAFVHPRSTHGVLIELKQKATDRGPRTEDRGPTTDRGLRTEDRGPITIRPLNIELGDLQLISLTDGIVKLDGGAMFGVVPKVLWARHSTADERNRIPLGLRPLIVRGVRTLLIDAGVGDKLDAKLTDIYGLQRQYHLDHALADAGLAPADIDIVLATHLHFDHCGGFTTRGADGQIRPRLPRAQYIIRRGEWDDAMSPNERTRGSYFLENYKPLADAGVLQLVDDDVTIMPGVRVCRTGGHTNHHQIVMIESKGKTAAFVADLIPTTAHLPEAWIMGYDLYPLDTLAYKRQFLKDAVDKEYLVFFEHDPSVVAGYIRQKGDKRVVEPVLTIDE